MAILNSLIPSFTADLVAIFPELPAGTFPSIPGIPGLGPVLEIPNYIPIQVFEGARPMRVQVSEPSLFMVHPLETGAPVIDHRIILPVEITIVFILRPENYRNTFQLMRQAYRSTIRFTVQTKVNTYMGMYISDLPHEEDPAFFDTITMVVQFTEAQFFTAQVQSLSDLNVINPIDASTIDRGEQSTSQATEAQNNEGGFLYRTFGGFLQ